MDRMSLLSRLDKVTDKTTAYVIQRGSPLSVDKKSIMIGNTFIQKNSSGAYDILFFDKTVIFSDISIFDVAVIIAQRYHKNEHTVIKQVLYLEEKFSKYHTDMMHYLHCMKSAKNNNNIERMAILEDKFQMAEQSAKDVRDKIAFFKMAK